MSGGRPDVDVSVSYKMYRFLWLSPKICLDGHSVIHTCVPTYGFTIVFSAPPCLTSRPDLSASSPCSCFSKMVAPDFLASPFPSNGTTWFGALLVLLLTISRPLVASGRLPTLLLAFHCNRFSRHSGISDGTTWFLALLPPTSWSRLHQEDGRHRLSGFSRHSGTLFSLRRNHQVPGPPISWSRSHQEDATDILLTGSTLSAPVLLQHLIPLQ